MIRKMLTGVLLLLTVCTAPAGASNFDCSVVYDEFDQLMMANFLIDPTQYVQTLNGALARNEYVLYQVDRFKLRSDRILPGIGIVRTNQNLRGKMIFYWQSAIDEELVPFMIEELILFGRIKDGHAPVRMNSIVTLPGFAVDLDTGSVVEYDDETADLIYEHDEHDFVVRAVEPAEIYFPIESMCREKNRENADRVTPQSPSGEGAADSEQPAANESISSESESASLTQ